MVVLLVEDDPAVRDVVQRALAARGVDVRAVSSGEEALEVEATTSVDVVVSDVQLPGVNGFQAVAEICRRSPWVRPIFMSAQFDAGLAEAAGWPPNVPVIRKPFRLMDLWKRIDSPDEGSAGRRAQVVAGASDCED